MKEKKVSEIKIKTNYKESVKFLNNINLYKDKPKFLYVANSRSGHNFIKDNVMSWMGYDSIQDSIYEYRNLENFKIDKFPKKISELSDEIYDKSIKILSLRDLLNWYTSYFYLFYKMIPENSFIVEEISELSLKIINPKNLNFRIIHVENKIEMNRQKSHYKTKQEKLLNQLKLGLDSWLLNAKEFNNETSFLKDFIHIYYDEFFESKQYRENICEQLNGTYNEDKLNIIPAPGNYSTFDGIEFQNNGQNMTSVLKRYEKWNPEHKIYLDMLFSHEAFRYYLNNFDLDIHKQEFISKYTD